MTLTRSGMQLLVSLIENIEKRQEGWKGKLLSRRGRLQLINSVMSSIPIYMMACFQLLKWAINRIDKTKKGLFMAKE